MFLLFIMFWSVVIVFGFMVAVRANTVKLNNLRRPDGSYADYDFPGILNDSHQSHQPPETDQHDLYGRPLPPEVIEKRAKEKQAQKQIVFVLQHTSGEDSQPKLLGVYGSRDRAEAAIERYRQLAEFARHPDGFHLVEQELDKDH